jgi:hypothetical protein
MSELLKSVIQDLINDRHEQAQVSIHDYIVGKTQEVAGLKEAYDPAFAAACADLVRDEDDPELSEDELKALIDKLAKKHKLNGKQKKELALAAEGPIGY